MNGFSMPQMGGWGTIGLCKRFGTKNMAIGAGIGFGAIGLIGGYLLFKNMANAGIIPQERVLLYSLGVGLASAAITALVVYFTCTGIEYGLPISKASRSK